MYHILRRKMLIVCFLYIPADAHGVLYLLFQSREREKRIRTSVSDPDPDSIRSMDPYPDPGGQNDPQK
jgi:hypothetical protein